MPRLIATHVQVLQGLQSASAGGASPTQLRGSVGVQTVVGLLRDLRGIAQATNSRRTYGEHACCSLRLRSFLQGSQVVCERLDLCLSGSLVLVNSCLSRHLQLLSKDCSCLKDSSARRPAV